MKTVDDAEAILDDPKIDAVVIVTPVSTHHALASAHLARETRSRHQTLHSHHRGG